MSKSEKPKPPANWREYIKGSFAVLGHTRWIWREFMNTAGRRLFVVTLVVILADSLFTLCWPYFFGQLWEGITQRAMTTIVQAVVIIAALEIVNNACDWLMGWLSEKLGAEQAVTLDTRMTELFFGKSLGQHLGDSQELSPANVKKGQSAVSGLARIILYQLIPTASKVIVLIALLFWLHWLAGLGALAYIVYSAVWSLYLNRRVMTEGEEINEELRAVDRYMDERWRNVERVKTSGKEAEERDRHHDMNRAAYGKEVRFWSWYHRMAQIRTQTSSAPYFIAVIAAGAWMVMNGEWTIASVMPLVFWTSNLTNSMHQLRTVERQINGQLPAIEALKKLMELEPAVKDPVRPKEFDPDGPVSVTMVDVGYSYPGKDPAPQGVQGKRKESKQVLKGVWLRAAAGEKVAIIGPSGTGKTTLLHLLLRSRDPDSGVVMVDGLDLRDIRQADLKRIIGYAPQGAPVFDGTIRELVLYGMDPAERTAITDGEIWTLLRTVRADFGDRLDNGLDTKIGRDGIELSGGERQRLSAAMALMNPRLRLLIMDEPTSSLDSETQKGFQDGLDAVLERGVTTFIVAHRLSTVRDCDKFVVLKPVSELADGESQIEAVASSFEELYGISPTFRRVADGEGLMFGPAIGVSLKDVLDAPVPLFGGEPVDLRA